MATDGSTTGIKILLNDTTSEEEVFHIDGPNDANFMICGVVIAMALVGLIIVLLALTISKLRKREEQQSNTARTEAVMTPPPPAPPLAFRQAPLWQFPPPLPPPYVYTNDQDNLQPIGNERASFRNLKKHLGGRWKRLVKRKPEQEVYSIPPELKPQLKQIYVY